MDSIMERQTASTYISITKVIMVQHVTLVVGHMVAFLVVVVDISLMRAVGCLRHST